MLTKEDENYGYFDELSDETKNLISELLEEFFNKTKTVDTYGGEGSYSIESLECKHSFNKGGLEIVGYSDLMEIFGSGFYPNNNKSKECVSKIIDISLKYAKESFFNENKEVLNKHNLDISIVDYHYLKDSEHKDLNDLADILSEYEFENLTGHESSVKYSIRFMYHGQDSKGIHSASISAALNTEAPYHRQKYDDNAKKIEISWRKTSALKVKLIKALKIVTCEVF